VDEIGRYVGGPMYYIELGLGPKWRWLAALFALFGMLASFGIGNMVQANSVADALGSMFEVEHRVTGAMITVLAGIVILGGIRRIASVAEKLVPFMAIAYFSGAALILALNYEAIPAAVLLIFHDAFNGTAASGGFAGAAVWMALRYGIARGIFSNEAGLGSAPIAHAAARTHDPVKQGMVGMLGTFIDTLVICTMSALVIIVTGVWNSGETGAGLSTLAFDTGLPDLGGYIVAGGQAVFAFTTILGWSYYGERCVEYLFGVRPIIVFRLCWLGAIMLGASVKLNIVWLFADVMNGLMAIPNLIGLILLSPVIFRMTGSYFVGRKQVGA
jgi:AGCS family alanine or glycine:cation symporter